MQVFNSYFFQLNKTGDDDSTKVFNTAVVIAKRKKVMAINPKRVQTQTSAIPLH